MAPVYCVWPARAARSSAATTGSGAVKSGSPMLMWMIGWPAASSAAARLASSITWKGSMRPVRLARG